ncbi:MAG: protein kinase [Gemmatimonadetes bacterium]|nr:protein kinase [Gemmatimonadota bacterium]
MTWQPSKDDTAPKRIGPYAIEATLGRGGMGVVYLARDPKLGREIALKVLPSHLATDPEALARFTREAQMLATINHPNIATIHSLEEDDGVHFLTMEHIRGETLAEIVRGEPLPLEEALPYFQQIAKGLEAAHKKGLIHRDLKPFNIMVTAEGLTKILDFGLAKSNMVQDDISIAQEVVRGTPGYMSPEQLRGEEVDQRADNWAYGCILYECLTGKQAFAGNTPSDKIAATLRGEPDWDLLREHASDAAYDLIRHLLHTDPTHRMGMISLARREVEEMVARQALPSGITTARREAQEEGAGNLPVQLASFVGRRTNLDEIGTLLAKSRLVTLTGAGGSGKTRLGIERGRASASAFPDGVWLVELAPLAEPGLVVDAVNSALGVSEDGHDSPGDALRSFLAKRNTLIILDNCEHVVRAAAELTADVLRASPDVRFLATSREGLGVPGETIYHVPPLGLPGNGNDPAALGESEAVQLFLDRAQSVSPSFELTSENSPCVARICNYLGGIPLALELAAARVKILPVREIADRLDESFRLLTGGSKTALPRHQTLRKLIDWSYELLTEEERRTLERLSVFSSGWTMDAAEAVVADDTIEDWEVLELLSNLVDKSLVELDEKGARLSGRMRYRMLETMRQYSLEKLRERGEETAIRRAHARCFKTLAAEAAPEFLGKKQDLWFHRMDFEKGNMRNAIDFALGPDGSPRDALAIVADLGRYYAVRSAWHENMSLYERVLGAPGNGEPTTERARALNWAGNALYWIGEYDRAKGMFDEALAIFEELGDRKGIAACYGNAGHLRNGTGDIEGAIAFYEKQLALREELQDRRGVASALLFLGNTYRRLERFDAAREALTKSMVIHREHEDLHYISVLHSMIGAIELLEGDVPEARRRFQESLVLYEKTGNKWGISNCLNQTGLCDLLEEHYDEARTRFLESLAIRKTLNDPWSMSESFLSAGWYAARRGKFREFHVLTGAGEEMRSRLRNARTDHDSPFARKFREEVAGQASQEEVDRWRREGVGLGEDEAALLAGRLLEA